MELVNLDVSQLDKTVWRYMSFSKFISLLTYQSLWFSKLNLLQDQLEGMIPLFTKQRMDAENQKWKKIFKEPEHHKQIDAWNSTNENDGRELLVVNCWFIGDRESKKMWRDYGKSNESVAVKSTIGRLAQAVLLPKDHKISKLGKVSYVNHEMHDMNHYEGGQAHIRAFLKDQKYSAEQELRIVTMNFKTTTCVNMLGVPYSPDEVSGAGMNNFENPGLYVGVLLENLIGEVIIAPGAEDWFVNLVKRIVDLSPVNVPVSKSKMKA